MKYQEYLQKKNLISRLFSESETWDPFTICTISEYASGLYEDNDEEVFINEELYEKAGNPLKVLMALIRLSGLESKYTKALVDQGAVELDFTRKVKAASKKGSEGADKDTLNKAKEIKLNALRDAADAIKEKIDTIADDSGSEWIKAKASRIKINAKMQKAKILLKIANKEEAKELGLQIKDLQDKITDKDNELKNYQKEEGADIEKAAREELKQKIEDKKTELKSINHDIALAKKGDSSSTKKDESLLYENDKLAGLMKKKKEILGQIVQLKQDYNKIDPDNEMSVDSEKEELQSIAKETPEETPKETPKEETPKEEPKETPKEETPKEEPKETEEESEEDKKKNKNENNTASSRKIVSFNEFLQNRKN